jgi:protein TonB
MGPRNPPLIVTSESSHCLASDTHLMKPTSLRLTTSLALLACALLAGACQSKPAAASSASAFTPPPPPTGILSHTEVDKAPRLREFPPPRPDYPVDMRRENISGSATVRFIITHDGRIIDVTVIQASHPSFGDAASRAVARWKYEPAVKDGQPIACYLSVPVVFDITGTGGP